MKRLYLLTASRLGDFYAITNDPTEVQESLVTALNKADTGFASERIVTNIKYITEEMQPALNDCTKLESSKNNTLLIVGVTEKQCKTKQKRIIHEDSFSF